MSSPFARTHALPGGPPVRLRLRAAATLPRCATCWRAAASRPPRSKWRGCSRSTPARAVTCACAPVGGRETVVGVGAIELRAGAEVDRLVVDEARTDGRGELLGEVLRRRAEGHAARVA